jgi:hypothetical protein
MLSAHEIITLNELFGGLIVTSIIILATRAGSRRAVHALAIGAVALLAVGVGLYLFALASLLTSTNLKEFHGTDLLNSALRVSDVTIDLGRVAGIGALVVVLFVSARNRRWGWFGGIAFAVFLLYGGYDALYGIYAVYLLPFLIYGTVDPFAFGGAAQQHGGPVLLYHVVAGLMLVLGAAVPLLYSFRMPRDIEAAPAMPTPPKLAPLPPAPPSIAAVSPDAPTQP